MKASHFTTDSTYFLVFFDLYQTLPSEISFLSFAKPKAGQKSSFNPCGAFRSCLGLTQGKTRRTASASEIRGAAPAGSGLALCPGPIDRWNRRAPFDAAVRKGAAGDCAGEGRRRIRAREEDAVTCFSWHKEPLAVGVADSAG